MKFGHLGILGSVFSTSVVFSNELTTNEVKYGRTVSELLNTFKFRVTTVLPCWRLYVSPFMSSRLPVHITNIPFRSGLMCTFPRMHPSLG